MGTTVIAGASVMTLAESDLASPPIAEAPVTSIITSEAPQIPSLYVGFPVGDRNLGFGAYPQEAKRATYKIGRNAILFAMGDTLIPSAPADPGYRDLEWYGITDEISRRIEVSDDDLDHFNRSSAELLRKKFTELAESRRADYFNRIVLDSGSKNDSAQKKLRETYSHVREMVFTVYYQNFPQHSWPRDSNRAPLLRPGDRHQITNPSTPDIVTGWDQACYAGPLTWEEEERRRNHFKKIKWQE